MGRSETETWLKRSQRSGILMTGCTFSFACQQLMPVWSEFSPPDIAAALFVPIGDLKTLTATLFATLIVFVIATCLVLLRNRINSVWVDRLMALFLSVSLINPLTSNGYPLFERKSVIKVWLITSEPAFWLGASAFILLLISFSWFRPSTVIRFIAIVLLAVLPVGLMQIGSSAWHVAMGPSSGTDMSSATSQTDAMTGSSNRILWVIFDELDRRAVFDAPATIYSFPAMTEFASESVAFTNAEQAGENTIDSVTGMTIGQKVLSADPKSFNLLDLTVAARPDDPPIDWAQAETLFSALSKSGARTGIAGWYFPYCRLFGKHLKSCKQVNSGASELEENSTLWQSVLSRLSTVNPLYRRVNAVEAFRVLLDHAMDMATDKELDFIYLHVPFPHQPTIYNAESKRFTALNFRRDGYFHNVAAVDEFFSRLRGAMRKAGTWDTTTVVLSADHGWRAPAPISELQDRGKIALFIKIAGQTTGGIYAAPFAATGMKRLLLGLSNGEIHDAPDLIDWLKKQ